MRILVAALLSGALTWPALVDYGRFARGQVEALALARQHGLEARHPQLAAEIGRHYDPVFARLRVARALLDGELDRSWLAALPPAERHLESERGSLRLRQARELAEAAWPLRPSSWEAAMVLGGATYLELYRQRDARLIAGAELWERPLLAAHRLGPSQTGPVRFLSAAHLGNWASLSDEQRVSAVELLRQGFSDRRTYDLLIRDWLRVAPSRGRALEPIPDLPWAWQALQTIFAEAEDPELEALARRLWRDSLGPEHARKLAAAETALEQGDERSARNILLALLEQLPRSLDFAPTLERLLALLPPGPTAAEHAAAFADWLEWAFELCLLDDCPLEQRSLRRLARLSGDLRPEQRALALLLAGDLARAQLVERRFAQTSIDGWAAYLLLEAERLAAAGRADEAHDSLARLPRPWQERPRYWLARRELARRADDVEAEAASDAELQRLARNGWEAADWELRGDSAVLELLASQSAPGLELEIVGASPSGALFDVYWDGALVAIRRSSGRRSRLELELPVTPGLHLLQLVFHAGGAARPGPAALL